MELIFNVVVSDKIGKLKAQLRAVEDDLVKALSGIPSYE